MKSSPLVRIVASILVALGALPSAIHAQEAICARVKIEIEQELSLERQAFEARMRINNGLDTLDLQDIEVEVLFTDEEGGLVPATSDPDAVGATFFLGDPQLDGISGVDGSGVVPRSSSGEVRWLIIPAPGAADGQIEGKRYFVGAVLRYTFGGQVEEVVVAPDFIVVKPQPQLALDYFLTREVRADDPFTPEIEPIEPFTLGLRVQNAGSGVARNVNLATGQPRIVENEQGLLIGFRITDGFVDDEPASPDLSLPFGDILPGDAATGRWSMETDLSGEFVEFDVTVTHADELGGAVTSLITSATAHSLIRDVRVDAPGRDAVRDFLAQDDGPLVVYESDSVDTEVADHSDVATFTLFGSSGPIQVYDMTLPPTAGPLYASVEDPEGGALEIRRVVREDGKEIPFENAWLQASGVGDETEHFVRLFDVNGGGTYRFEMGAPLEVPLPPVIAFFGERTIEVGTGRRGFAVNASDPNGTIPALSVEGLPAGSTFLDGGDGSGLVEWEPTIDQVGRYPITIRATDGVLSAARRGALIVVAPNDLDGDGMPDDEELAAFGTTDRDGTGDLDGDGILDRDELARGLDPNFPGIGGVPLLVAPIPGSKVAIADPLLVVENAPHGANPVFYEFELFEGDDLIQPLAISGPLPESLGETSWRVPLVLDEDAAYVWRARLVDGDLNSEWTWGDFVVDAQNATPSPPIPSAPVETVPGPRPTLEVANATDPDGDPLRYAFLLFEDVGLTQEVARVSGLPAGADGFTRWEPPVDLASGATYFWLAGAEDPEGASAASGLASFQVDAGNQPPPAPSVLEPAIGSVLALGSAELVVIAADDPEGSQVSVFFELDRSPDFASSELLQSGPILPESPARFAVAGLADGDYFWRARASDGSASSAWTLGRFAVQASNQAPPTPVLANPGEDAAVELLRPPLTVVPVEDPDGDAVGYEFEVFRDPALVDRVFAGRSDAPTWRLVFPLEAGRPFFWRARAIDEAGAASAFSEAQRFFVVPDGVDDPPRIRLLAPDSPRTVLGGTVAVQWSDADPDSNAVVRVLANGATQATRPEDPDGSGDRFEWPVEGLTAGDYQLRVEIEDPSGQDADDACCLVTVVEQASGVTVVAPADPVTDEAGVAMPTTQVVLDVEPLPGATVVIPVSTSDPTEGMASRSFLQFTDADWDVPQPIMSAGADDCVIDGDVAHRLVLGAITSDDPRFDGLDPADVDLTNLDNETPGQELFVCTYQLVGQTPIEGGARVEAEFRAVLENRGADPQPASTGTPSLAPSGMELVGDGAVDFPSVAPGGSEASVGTFVVRFAPAAGFDPAKLSWAIEAVSNDQDEDGVLDGADNCPFTPNAGQEDVGGIGFGSAPDGIGDACQCGDVTGNGVVTNGDALQIRRSLLVPPTATLGDPALCDVGGSASCSGADSLIIRRALLNPPTAAISQQCAPANP